jgi:uncharacterized protein DUF3617
LLTGAWLSVGVSRAEDPPQFKQGLWQFDRTVGGQKLQTRECTSPTDELKRQNALLAKKGCKFTPTERSGNSYSFTAECTITAPGAQSVSARSTSVMRVEGDSAYSVEINTTGAGTSTRESLIARRVGDCAK